MAVKITITNKDQSEILMINDASQSSWRKAYDMAKSYFFHSDEKLVACLLLIGSILCVVGFVALLAALTWWSSAFFTILTAKEFAPFIVSMEQFLVILTGIVGIQSLKNNLIGRLSNRWRLWLTAKLVDDLFNNKNNYLALKRLAPKEIDNIAQRIQDDVKNMVELVLKLSIDLITSALSLGTFVGTLWQIGGPLSLAANRPKYYYSGLFSMGGFNSFFASYFHSVIYRNITN